MTGSVAFKDSGGSDLYAEALVAVMDWLGADSAGRWRAWFDTERDGHLESTSLSPDRASPTDPRVDR